MQYVASSSSESPGFVVMGIRAVMCRMTRWSPTNSETNATSMSSCSRAVSSRASTDVRPTRADPARASSCDGVPSTRAPSTTGAGAVAGL